MLNNGVSLADIAAVTDGNRDGFGDGGWWAWILIFALFGWGGNGFGFGGQNGVGAEVQRGFDTQAIISKLDGINNGICSLGYDQLAQMNGINVNMMQGFNAVQSQAADCYCQTQRAIDAVRYDMATDTCAITTAVNQGFSQLDRTINDKFCELEMRDMQRTIDEQQSLIQSLNLAQSQANQNNYLVNALRPSPIPAYQVANPYAGCGCYQQYNGCGCC